MLFGWQLAWLKCLSSHGSVDEFCLGLMHHVLASPRHKGLVPLGLDVVVWHIHSGILAKLSVLL